MGFKTIYGCDVALGFSTNPDDGTIEYFRAQVDGETYFVDSHDLYCYVNKRTLPEGVFKQVKDRGKGTVLATEVKRQDLISRVMFAFDEMEPDPESR